MITEPANLITIMHHLRTMVSQIKPQGNITMGEFCALRIIGKENSETGQKLTPTSLNEVLGTKRPATSRILGMLEQKAYVIRRVDEKDHRICYLELTEAGEQVLECEMNYFQGMLERVASRLGSDAILQMEKTLEYLGEIIEEEMK